MFYYKHPRIFQIFDAFYTYRSLGIGRTCSENYKDTKVYALDDFDKAILSREKKTENPIIHCIFDHHWRMYKEKKGELLP